MIAIYPNTLVFKLIGFLPDKMIEQVVAQKRGEYNGDS